MVEAVALVYERDHRPSDDMRIAKGRARSRITEAIKQGILMREPDGTFILGNFVSWARVVWPGKFSDLPTFNGAHGMMPPLTGHAEGSTAIAIPESTEGKIARIIDLERRVTELIAENARLRPDAEAYRRNCEKNKKSAQQPRTKAKR